MRITPSGLLLFVQGLYGETVVYTRPAWLFERKFEWKCNGGFDIAHVTDLTNSDAQIINVRIGQSATTVDDYVPRFFCVWMNM